MSDDFDPKKWKPLSETGSRMSKARYTKAQHTKDGTKQKVQEYMIANPDDTIREIATKYALSERTVAKWRKNLVDEGLVTPSYFDRRSSAGIAQNEDGDFGARNLVDVVRKTVSELRPGDKQLTAEESLLSLSNLARAAERDGANKLAIEAHKAFHSLKSQSKETILGPAPPLTHDEKIERCSRVLEAAGLRAARGAWLIAFPGKGLEHGEKAVVNVEPQPQNPLWTPETAGSALIGTGDL